jgi:hypothetical protein
MPLERIHPRKLLVAYSTLKRFDSRMQTPHMPFQIVAPAERGRTHVAYKVALGRVGL